ncbi:hypothetical protein ACFVQB_09080 [Paenibacillus sp. NPDC057886]|uniref:hypothetical protein n=1 Tax=Paenibacillus sp. NPDC057886 TaxID=3346270 RepID=UPI0036ACBDD5
MNPSNHWESSLKRKKLSQSQCMTYETASLLKLLLAPIAVAVSVANDLPAYTYGL